MKGMIFAAGIGSRLKPWTDSHPKALVEIGNRPIIANVIDKMLQAGINSIVINVHHFAQQVIDYVKTTYPNIDIVFSDESDMLLDTGGGLSKALPLFDNEDVVIHNADIYTDLDIQSFIQSYRQSNADAMLLTQKRNTSRYFLFNNNILAGWTNISTGQIRPHTLTNISQFDHLAFGGVHILSHRAYASLANYAPKRVPFSITNFYIDSCNTLNIRAYNLPEGCSWFDVGKPETLKSAQQFYDISHLRQ